MAPTTDPFLSPARLGLGTAQFGFDYGVANRTGRPARAEIRAILEFAAAHGVVVLDTASAYGESEAALGACLWDGHPFRIVTKLPPGLAENGKAGGVDDWLRRSLDRLRQDRVHGLMAHRSDDLLGPGGQALFAALERARAAGLVDRIGVSVYHDGEAAAIRERFPITIIQCPLNVFDQRMLREGFLESLAAEGVEIHARSVFLQGLLLMEPRETADYFRPWRGHLEDYRTALAERGVSPLEGALAFVNGLAGLGCFLCGVETLAQLQEIHQAIEGAGAFLPAGFFHRFGTDDTALINPSQWRLH